MMHPRRDPGGAARELVELLDRARPIPLTNQVRVDKQTAVELVDSIRQDVAEGGSGLERLAETASDVEQAVHQAVPVPLTDQVRLPRERVEELARALRTAGA